MKLPGLDLVFLFLFFFFLCPHLLWHFSLTFGLWYAQFFISGVWNKRLAPCWENLSLSSSRRMHTPIYLSLSLSLSLPLHSHIQMQTITFYLFSKIRILNHLSNSAPSIISNIYSHSNADLPLYVSPYLPSSPHKANSPGDTPVKYECAQWSVVVLEGCPDHELCFPGWIGS